MGREEKIALVLQSQPLHHPAGSDPGQIFQENLRHGRAYHKNPLWGQTGGQEVSSGMLGIAQIEICGDVYNPPVDLFRHPAVKAAVSRLQMKNRYLQTTGGNG